MDKTNLQVIREAFGRVVYSHKTHEKEAEIQLGYANWVKWINIILIAVTTGSLLKAIFSNEQIYVIVSAITSVLTLGFSIFQLSFNPEQKGSKHKQVANSLWLIREKYIGLMTDIITGALNKSEITTRRDAFISDLDLIYKSAPSTSNQAYEKAREALQIKDEFTFSDHEINQFLPVELHIKGAKR